MKSLICLILFSTNALGVVFDINTSFDNMDYYKSFLKAVKNNNEKDIFIKGNNLLKIPDRYSNQFWYGNLIHAVHIALGHSYLKKNELEKASYHLLKSVDDAYVTKAKVGKFSPQLESFGPDGKLAYALYKKGKKDKLMAYLKQVNKFWNKENQESGGVKEVYDYLKETYPSEELPSLFKNDFIENTTSFYLDR